MNVLSLSLDTTLAETGASPNEAQRRQLGYLHELQRRRPGSRLFVIVRTTLGFEGEPLLLDSSLEVHPVAFPVVSFIWGAYKRAALVHARYPLDLVVSQSPFLDGWAAWSIGRQYRAPWLCQLHMPPLDNPRWLAEAPSNRLRGALAQVMLRQADAVRVVSGSAAVWLRERVGVAPQRVRLIPVGTPLATLEQAVPVEAGDTPTVLFVGRLAQEKGVDVLLRAWQRVHREEPQVRLVIAGDGPLREDLQTLAANLGVQDCLQWPRWVPQSDLPRLYRAAALVAVPSHYEAYGRVIVEAMSAGRTVVASDTDGARELITTGRTGVLVPVGDEQAFAAQIVRLLRDSAQRRKLGDAARNAIGAQYDAGRLREELVQMWIEVAIR